MEVAAGHRIADTLHAFAFKSNESPTRAIFQPLLGIVPTNYARRDNFSECAKVTLVHVVGCHIGSQSVKHCEFRTGDLSTNQSYV